MTPLVKVAVIQREEIRITWLRVTWQVEISNMESTEPKFNSFWIAERRVPDGVIRAARKYTPWKFAAPE